MGIFFHLQIIKIFQKENKIKTKQKCAKYYFEEKKNRKEIILSRSRLISVNA